MHGWVLSVTVAAKTATIKTAKNIPVIAALIRAVAPERETVCTVSVNDIKKHIHDELFGKSIFQNSRDNLKSIENIKGHWKKETIQCSIRIMRNHNQTDAAIREMLQTKFFLDEEAIRQFWEEKE